MQSTFTIYVPVNDRFNGEAVAATSVTRFPDPSATKRPSRLKGVPSVLVTPELKAPVAVSPTAPVVVVPVVVVPLTTMP